jgi:hypothetical protein
MRLRLLTAALLAAVLAACGSSGGSGGNSASSGTASATTATTTVPVAPTPAKGAVPWPVPPDPMALARAAGLTPEPAERLQYHVHAHLDVFVNGTRTEVPAGIGIDTSNPAVKSFNLDGGKVGWGLESACATPCISPLHTHDPSGIVHTESATPTPNVLGQFFTQWDVALDANCVGGYCKPAAAITVYIDGAASTGDPTKIELADGREIAIVIGTPPAIIPSTFDPSAA